MPEGLPISAAEAWDLLSNVRRRRIVLEADRADGAIAAQYIAREIASYETGIPADQLYDHQWHRVYNHITSGYLTRLDELGVIDHDPDDQLVAPTGTTASVAAWIRRSHHVCEYVDEFPAARNDDRETET